LPKVATLHGLTDAEAYSVTTLKLGRTGWS
jgi:hypothetical protein